MRTTQRLDRAAGASLDSIARGARAEWFDFEAYRARASQVAGWLRGRGKTNTAFLGMNGDVLPVLLFASGMAGTPFVPLNYRLADADLNKLVARTAPAVLVVDDAMLSRIAPVDGIELVARSDFEAEFIPGRPPARSEAHTSELQSLMRNSND